MRAAVAGLLGSLLVVLTGAVARADVDQYLGRPITSVRLETEGRSVAEPRLLALVETRVGQPLSAAAVRETIAHLASLGRFQDVRAHAAVDASGVALLYELVPVHPVTRLAFTGTLDLPGIDEGRLRRAVVARYGAAPTLGRAADLARVVEDELRLRGYLRARVATHAQIEHSPDRATLVFTIDAGQRTRVGAVDVAGDPGMPVSEFLGDLNLTSGMVYEPDELNARIQQYIENRRSRGYYAARLVLTTRFTEEDRVANLLLTVTPGPRVRVVFTGDPVPADRRDELVPIAREGSADEDLLEDSSNGIEEYLRAQGYRDAAAPHARDESDGELAITFNVTRGRQYRVARVEFAGNAAMPLSAFADRLRLREGQPFSAFNLDADVATIEDLYRRAGFSAVKVDSGVDPLLDAAGGPDIPVTVRIIVTENVRTMVASVTIDGNASLADAELKGLGLQAGQPLFLPQMAIDRDLIRVQYANRGYQNVTVDSNPGLSADGSRADIVFTVREGPLIRVDHVLVVGNTRTRTETIERELLLRPGEPLGLEAVAESQRRLAALGLFRRTRITELRHGDETTRDVVVTIEEAPVTSLGFGGGLEAGTRIRVAQDGDGVADERLELAPRAFFEIGRRNLLGKNRSINLFMRVSLRPDRFENQPQGDTGGGSGYGFSEYRVLGTFREPRLLGTNADAYLTGTAEQQVRSSFNFARRAFSAEAARPVARFVSASGNYQIQRTELFDDARVDPADKLLIDRLFPQVRLSSFSLSAVRNTRDDPVNPSGGHYVSANGQLAARRIGSEVGFAKTYLTAQVFRTLPRSRQVVLAASARVGIAAGFPRDVLRIDDQGEPVAGAGGQPIVDVVKDLPASERFFAGGDTTVRGFALDQLGTPDTIDSNGFSIGGNAVVIFNTELRVPIRGGLDVVGFLDAGNVFARTADLDLARMRSAVGFGVRYRSPVGPIRVDLGFKTNRRDIVPDRREPLTALHISLGQAF